MPTVYWTPRARAVTQVDTVQITAYDANTTYSLAADGLTLVSVSGNTSANQTATDLSEAWNLSTHPYAATITASAATDTVTLTADAAEVPHIITSAASGGTGTIGNVTSSTAPTGPHTVTNGQNWSTGNVPADGDVIVIANSDVSLLWGLDGLSTGNHTLRVEATFTGRIGLDPRGLERDAAGGNITTSAPEYRQRYLELDFTRGEIGEHTGLGRPAGSQHLLINNTRSAASRLVVHTSQPAGDTATNPPIRYLAAHAGADVEVRDGVIGVAVALPGETSTIGNVTLDEGAAYIGPGVTISGTWEQRSGNSQLTLRAATLSAATVLDGSMRVEGNQVITALEVWGGTVICNTTGNVTTANARGGRLHFRSAEAHTVPTLNIYRGGSVQYDPDVTTVNTLAFPDDGPQMITVSEARG